MPAATEKASPERLAYIRAWQLANHDKRRATCTKYNHSDKAKVVDTRYRKSEKNRECQRRYDNTPEGFLRRSIRDRLRKALKREFKAGSAVRDLGCSVPQFREWVAAQFKPGMSWDNYGEWHLDHVKPLAAFDLTDRKQFLEAFHFLNYQPLWAAENLRKGAHYA